MITNIKEICQLAIEVIEIEAEAVLNLRERINEDFAKACQLLLSCQGRIVFIGMGKSGHIGSKLAATFSSTGSPAFFLHPSEASHGDLGAITKKDVVVVLSNSGNTPEILALLPAIKKLNVPIISLTGNPNSTLAKKVDVNLNISVDKEACPLGLAPTSSTTATLVMGDALAVVLLKTRGFTAQDFARVHPGGILGKRLSLMVADIMRTGKDMPVVKTGSLLTQALMEMTQKSIGMTVVVAADGKLAGIFTDGDLRRLLDKKLNLQDLKIEEVMTKTCKTIPSGMSAIDALKLMEDCKITVLIIVEDGRPRGVIHMHDLLSIGLA